MSRISISIIQGIYSSADECIYYRNGYFHDISRQHWYSGIPDNLKYYLIEKGKRFYVNYGIYEYMFTFGRDNDNGIDVITICHPFFDGFNEKLSESITIGRIKRMRGDFKKNIYERDEYKKDVVIYRKDGSYRIKTINCTRIRLDIKGDPVVKRKVFYKPYNLDKALYDKYGNFIRLKYPYIYKSKE